jgi:hypothetical protein
MKEVRAMRSTFTVRVLSAGAALVLVLGAVGPAGAQANVRVTRDSTPGSYLRYDGASDATMEACSTGRRSQNEPSVAVNPRNPQIVVAGSNDYCAQIVNGDVWTGYYRSTDGGTSWTNSLIPGYAADESAAGQASPAHGKCVAAGDPTQAFDGNGRLFYGFICFNRVKPINGSVYVATYDQDGARYVRTVLVDAGSPSGQFFAGLFQDKINITADPARNGNVYVAWARYNGFAKNNVILFSRSTDHGQTFSRPIRLTPGLAEEQFADLDVAPNGNVYLTFRTFTVQGPTQSAIWVLRSTDGGVSWSAPQRIATITPFDSPDFGGNDCGDGPFRCATGFTYSRFASLSAVAADETGVHVVWSAREADGQAKIFVRNSPDGISWPTPALTLDSWPVGHQWFPDVDSADGVITVVFHDSRADGSYSPAVPPGNTALGKNSGNVVHTFVAQSGNGGVSWTEKQITTAGSNYGWETHGARRVGFWGDYNYVSSMPGGVNVTWTDSRDLVPGMDPREVGEDDDMDNFDVFQPCTYEPNDIDAPSYTSPTIDDPCLSQGGLDENIYAARP